MSEPLPGKHSPARLSTYLAVHENIMARMANSGFVLNDGLIVSFEPGAVVLSGDIQCAGGIVINVDKTVAFLDSHEAESMPLVQTARYRYNVHLSGRGVIFRYDSPHLAEGPAHHLEHHKHTYDVLGDGSQNIQCIYDPDMVPTLGEVIDEASDWFYENVEALHGPVGS